MPHQPISRWLETSFGRTHVLITGPETAPPVLLLPGGNALGPLVLSWFAPLVPQFRLYTPDLLGQPGLSDQTKLSLQRDDHARWLTELLDGLKLGPLPIIGVSYGGAIALRLATANPARITKLALVVPAGFIVGPMLPLLWRVLLPMLLYQQSPTPATLDRATSPLLSERDDALSNLFGAIYQHLRLDTNVMYRVSAADLRSFTAPTLLIASANDPFFPGKALLQRARAVLPHLTATLLTGQHHIPSRAALATINDRVRDFLAASQGQP